MMRRAALISSPYLAEQRALHARPEGYGGKGHKWAATVRWLAAALDASSVLDYGCGQGHLVRALQAAQADGARPALRLADYDPAIAGKDGMPLFADLVVCTDVLEHVEPNRLDNVLTHLHQLARMAVFLVVALDPANKQLSDGRNAHLTLESPRWWAARVQAAGFTLEDHLPAGLPLPVAYADAGKRNKRWIAIARPRPAAVGGP